MGLFDSLFMAADLVKDGIAAFKATERLEELAGQATDYYEEQYTDENRRLLAEWERLHKKWDAIQDADERNKLTEEVERALATFLLSLTTNPGVSKKFKKEITDAVAEYNRTNGSADELFAKYMRKQAKTPEEKAEVERVLAEIAAEEDAKKKQ